MRGGHVLLKTDEFENLLQSNIDTTVRRHRFLHSCGLAFNFGFLHSSVLRLFALLSASFPSSTFFSLKMGFVPARTKSVSQKKEQQKLHLKENPSLSSRKVLVQKQRPVVRKSPSKAKAKSPGHIRSSQMSPFSSPSFSKGSSAKRLVRALQQNEKIATPRALGTSLDAPKKDKFKPPPRRRLTTPVQHQKRFRKRSDSERQTPLSALRISFDLPAENTRRSQSEPRKLRGGAALFIKDKRLVNGLIKSNKDEINEMLKLSTALFHAKSKGSDDKEQHLITSTSNLKSKGPNQNHYAGIFFV